MAVDRCSSKLCGLRGQFCPEFRTVSFSLIVFTKLIVEVVSLLSYSFYSICHHLQTIIYALRSAQRSLLVAHVGENMTFLAGKNT
jgi:hypothetical protein